MFSTKQERSGLIRSRSLRVELLENRTLLSAATVTAPGEGGVNQSEVAFCEWIIQVDDTKLAAGDKVQAMQGLLDSAWADAKWEAEKGDPTYRSLCGIYDTPVVEESLGCNDIFLVRTKGGLSCSLADTVFKSIPGAKYVDPNLYGTVDAFPHDPPNDYYYMHEGEWWPDGRDYLWGLNNTGHPVGELNYRSAVYDADIDAPEAWAISTGSSSTVVAVLDYGADLDHEDLEDNLWVNLVEANGTPGFDDDGNGYDDDIHGVNFFNLSEPPQDPENKDHGTHVSGTIGAVGNNGPNVGKVIGVCPEVSIMVLRVADDGGHITSARVIKALQYVEMMKRDYGVNIVATNNSYFLPDPLDESEEEPPALNFEVLEGVIEDQGEEEILFVTSAGNKGFDIGPSATTQYPAALDCDNMIVVGASDASDEWWPLSNWGDTEVDLVAPGVRIVSTLNPNEANSYSDYGVKSGTSMATPHVTGAVALLASSAPSATALEIKEAILNTVDTPASLSVGPATVTRGRLNAARALKALDGVADAPEGESQSLIVTPGQGFDGQVCAKDPETTTLTYSISQNVEHGELTLESDGSFTYQPQSGWTGLDQFSFIASDGQLQSGATMVELMVGNEGDVWREIDRENAIHRALFEEYGASVAIDGDYMVVGSPGLVWQNDSWWSDLVYDPINDIEYRDGDERAGALLYKRVPGEGWLYVNKFMIPDEEADGTDIAYPQAGFSVAIDGDTVVVSSPNLMLSQEDYSRSVYVFEDTSQTQDWSEMQRTALIPTTGNDEDDYMNGFGYDVALECGAACGDVIAVGARFDSDYGTFSGAVHLFVKGEEEEWSEITDVKIGGAYLGSHAFFGEAVEISGDTLVVGAPGDSSNQGATYFFTDTSANSDWTQTSYVKVTVPTGIAGDWFGSSLDIDGDRVVIGAPKQDQGADADVGAAYVVTRQGGSWNQTPVALSVSGAEAGDQVGCSVAIDDSWILLGAIGDDTGAQGTVTEGAAYVFKHSASGWSQAQVLTAAKKYSYAAFGHALDIEGPNAVIGAPGYGAYGAVNEFSLNYVPSVNDLQVELTSATAYSGQITASDPEGDTIQYIEPDAQAQGHPTDEPDYGTLSQWSTTNGTFVYTPSVNFPGYDSFTFWVDDGYDHAEKTFSINTLPQVTGVGVSGSDAGWAGGVIDSVDWADDNIPWDSVDRIVVHFDEPLTLQTGHISIVDSAQNSLTVADLDPVDPQNTVSWIIELSAPLSEEDEYTITIADDLEDAEGFALDGEMTGGVFPSGNNAAGGDWTFVFRTLTGDASADGYVGQADLDIVLANWGDSVSPGDRTCGDVDVDGTINSGDLNVVRAYWGNGTPPGRAASGSSSSLARPPVTIDDVDNSSQRSLSGYVTQDLLFEAVQDWLSAELRLELTSGRLYQDRYGSDLTPSEKLIDAHPTVEYDTYLSANGPENPALTIGGAVDLGGSADLTMNETTIDAAWFGTSDTDIGDVLLSRVTISDDAVGIWSLLVSDVGGGSYLVSGTISKGVLRLTM